jgi:hypothetical protein
MAVRRGLHGRSSNEPVNSVVPNWTTQFFDSVTMTPRRMSCSGHCQGSFGLLVSLATLWGLRRVHHPNWRNV